MSVPKYVGVQPSEVEKLPYWEYEYMIDDINIMIEEEKKRADAERADAERMHNSMKRSMKNPTSAKNFKRSF